MSEELAGRLAVVTGGSSGIGELPSSAASYPAARKPSTTGASSAASVARARWPPW